MQVNEMLNIIAIILSPIIAVFVGCVLQNRDKKREDKMEIFKALMANRGLSWNIESVKGLNLINVVFCDDKKVLDQWKIYYDRLCVENPSETEMIKMKKESDKLLDAMAKSLGYNKTVTWDTIQNPYIYLNGLWII